jgi:hypothetical protein
VRINAEESASSFQLALENGALQAKVADYEQALRAAGEAKKTVIGVVFAVNGKVTCAEVYGSNAIFQKAWPKLLNSAATEALAEKTSKALPPAPSAKEVERYLACAEREEAQPRQSGTSAGVRINTEEIPNEVDNTGWRVGNVAGRGNATRTRILANGGTNPADPEVFQTEGRPPTSQTERFQTEGRPDRFQTEGRVIQRGGAQPQPAPNLNPVANNNEVQDLLDELRPLNRAPAQPANPAGNRLNVNRVDNRSALVTESRDPARQNAVIHKSYIKK